MDLDYSPAPAPLLPRDYYKQVVRAYGGKVAENPHFQFREFPGKTFVFNKKGERLEVCSTHYYYCIVFSLLIVNL